MPLTASDYCFLKDTKEILDGFPTIGQDILPILCYKVLTREDVEHIEHKVHASDWRYGLIELIERYRVRASDLKPFIDALSSIRGMETIAHKLRTQMKIATGDPPQVDCNEMMREIERRLRMKYKRNFCSILDQTNGSQRVIDVGTEWVNLRIQAPSASHTPNIIGDCPTQESADYLAELINAFPRHDMFLILGRKGYGKTTLLRRLAFDWANGSLPGFHLVLCARPSRRLTKTTLDMALDYFKKLNYLPKEHLEFLKSGAFRSRLDLDEGKTRVLLAIDDFESGSDACEELETQLHLQDARGFDYKVALLTADQSGGKSPVATPIACILRWKEEHVRKFMELYFGDKREVANAMMKFFEEQEENVKEKLAIPCHCCKLCSYETNGDLQATVMTFLEKLRSNVD